METDKHEKAENSSNPWKSVQSGRYQRCTTGGDFWKRYV